jgi:hypothetical protein
MLFDLRSRRRRRAVQVIYVLLALLMLSGLVLFGVGTGNNNGGLLNALGNSGSSGTSGVDLTAVNSAIKSVKKNPSSAADWANLVIARYSAAEQGSNFNSAAGTFTASGRRELAAAALDWKHYLSLTKDRPDLQVSNLMAQGFGALGQFKNQASAWQYVAADESPADRTRAYECLAASAYAAKDPTLASLAAARAQSTAPKADRTEIKDLITESKTTTAVASQDC